MSSARSVVAFPSPPNDRNYFRAMVDKMIPVLRSMAIGEIISYDKLMECIEADSLNFARRVYIKAKKHVRIHDGLFFKTRHCVGYERVSADESVSLCDDRIRQGMKTVQNGVDMTYSIPMADLTENKRNHVIHVQSVYSNIRMLQDLSGN